MIGNLNKRVKKLSVFDIGLVKFSVATSVLFLITIWSAAMNWVHSVNPWYFLIVALAFGARPFYRFYIK